MRGAIPILDERECWLYDVGLEPKVHIITVHHGNWTATVEHALALSEAALSSMREAIDELGRQRLGVHTQALRSRFVLT